MDSRIYLENLLASARLNLLLRTRTSRSGLVPAHEPDKYCMYCEDCVTALAMLNFAAMTSIAFVLPLPAAYHHTEWTTLLLLVVGMFGSSAKERPTSMY
jgi:hypothetical protein